MILQRKITLISIPIFLFLFYLSCVVYSDTNHLSIGFNKISGELSVDSLGGWSVSPPWVLVTKLDLRPQRVCVFYDGKTPNCKLVRFKKESWRKFISFQGFSYYWWSNRFSVNMSHQEETRGFKDILRGLAYYDKKQIYIEVITETE